MIIYASTHCYFVYCAVITGFDYKVLLCVNLLQQVTNLL